MIESEREKLVARILDAAIPDRRERLERYDPVPVVVRLVLDPDDLEAVLLVKATAAERDRAALLRAIRAEIGPETPVRFTP